MAAEQTLTGELAESLADVIHDVDHTIGENKTYGAGIGPHDENDQVDALVMEARRQNNLPGDVSTAKSNPSDVKYPGGQSADLILETSELTEYCEAKLFRFVKANGYPSPQGYSKVFSPYQSHSPRSFIHDVDKLADADIRVAKTLLGIYYRPVEDAGSQITGEDIAEKFVSDVGLWTDHEISIDTVAPFSGLQHNVHQRGAVLAWKVDDQPERFF
ncbi:hypothetical protein CV102_17255 [Natronococcus pandeyae]|uniref:Uncharacterized protein n=1 Tax=Natronococcus pandeyae TaxID=2055836 RepID=A0A8J8Q129_9EURY|nr:hypothetical protein [Natronococcus pandeyae]TYL37367.1 hypothetical protein CV102_17255 [Natronococcus pandeyae]